MTGFSTTGGAMSTGWGVFDCESPLLVVDCGLVAGASGTVGRVERTFAATCWATVVVVLVGSGACVSDGVESLVDDDDVVRGVSLRVRFASEGVPDFVSERKNELLLSEPFDAGAVVAGVVEGSAVALVDAGLAAVGAETAVNDMAVFPQLVASADCTFL